MALLQSRDFTGASGAFQRAIDLDSKNIAAIKGMATASFQLVEGQKDPIDRDRLLDDSARWNQMLVELQPNDKQAHYTLGVIAWTKAYGELLSARNASGMKSEDPGPLTGFRLRQEMRARYGTVLDDGIAEMEKSLQLDPKYSDAMAYLNLLLRARADVRDTPEEAAQDTKLADEWVAKAMTAKRREAGTPIPNNMAPLPPPPPGPQSAFQAPPGTIRVGGNVAGANLVTKVDPVYPPLGRQARIQGTVNFNALIGKDGHVEQLQVVSGHPLLAGAAQTAVMQWVYRPTSLNGQPVDVLTTISVNFSLNP